MESLADLYKKELDYAVARYAEAEAQLAKKDEMLKSLKYDKRHCPCGGIILADTDECKVPVCANCFEEIGKLYYSKDEVYNEGFAAAMMRKTSCCEKNEALVKMMASAMENQLSYELHYRNDDGSKPDICDVDSWDLVGNYELREILVDVLSTSKKALDAYRKAIET